MTYRDKSFGVFCQCCLPGDYNCFICLGLSLYYAVCYSQWTTSYTVYSSNRM